MTLFYRIFILVASLLMATQAMGQTLIDSSVAEPLNVKEVELTPQSDFTPKKTATQAQTYWHPNPNRAMWYSVLCPGLGQIYNRSYWKVPVIYGGAAVFGYLISWQGRMYNDYSNAYYDIMDNDPNTKSYETMFRNINATEEWKKNTLKKKSNYYRRYRDLCIFGVALLYVVNVVDAFVDGHLYDFSVTDDLSIRMEPVFHYSGSGLNVGGDLPQDQTMLGLQCRISF